VVFVVVVVYSVGLGALGGYIGVYLYEEDVL
jgi:ketopantoate reductase